MTTDITLPIPGLRLEFLDPQNAEILSDGGRLHFLIKLDELQHQHLMGRVHKASSPSDEDRVRDLNTRTFPDIPWHLLGAFFYCAEPGQRTTNPENLVYRNIGNLLRRHIKNNPFNAIFSDELNGPTVPTSVQFEPEPGETLPRTPVVLALDVEFDRFRTFYRQYRRQVRSVTGRSFLEEVEPLRKTLGSRVRSVEDKLAEQSRIVRPMRKAVAHLHVGDILLQAALDFDESLPVRRALWKGVKFDADGVFTDPVPTRDQVRNVIALRGDWRRMMAAGENFVAYHASGERLDPLTVPILTELRNHQSTWKRYFDERHTLHPAVRAELLQTISDALDCVVLGKDSRAKLVKREVALIAEHVSLAFDASKTSDADAALVRELVSLDVPQLLPADSPESPIFDVFKESIKWLHDATETTEKSLEGLSILNVLTPVIVAQLRDKDGTGRAAIAWLWRAAVGTGDVEAESLRRLQNKMLEFLRGNEKAPTTGLKITSPIPPRLASAVGVGAAFITLVSDMLAIHTAYEEASKSKSRADGVVTVAKGATAIKSTAKFAEALTEALSKTLANKSASRWFSRTSKTLKTAAPLIDISTEFLTFVASTTKANERDILRTAQEQDDLDTAKWLDGLSILVTALALAPQFKILVVIFNVARLLVENKDVWLPAVIPDLTAPAHSQKFLASHIETLLKDDSFRSFVQSLDNKKVQDTPSGNAHDMLKAAKELKDRLGRPSPDSAPGLWNLGGRVQFGHATERDSIRVLRDIYDFPEDAAIRIVEGTDE